MKFGDRVQETTATTGTGALSLAGATDGHRGFVAEIGTGETCTYLLESGTDWEIGTGTVTDATPDTLSRTLIKSSTGALLVLAVGTHTVSCVATATFHNESVQSADVRRVVTLTETQYDALDPKVATTLYIVTPDA